MSIHFSFRAWKSIKANAVKDDAHAPIGHDDLLRSWAFDKSAALYFTPISIFDDIDDIDFNAKTHNASTMSATLIKLPQMQCFTSSPE